MSGKVTQSDIDVGDGDFDALVEQLRSLLMTAQRGHDHAVRRLEEESRQFDQEKSQFDQDRVALCKEITRLEQLSRKQAHDLALLAQVNDEKTRLEEQCNALRQELEDLQATQRELVSQMEQAEAEQKRASETASESRAEAATGTERQQSAAARQPSSPGAATVNGPAKTGPSKTGKESQRIAMPCQVVVRHPVFNEEVSGWAVERSLESLALLVGEQYPAGTSLKVRSGKSVHRTWLDIVVDDCQAERASYRLECSFVSPVTWSDVQHLAD